MFKLFVILISLSISAKAFVLVGPVVADENTLNMFPATAPEFTTVTSTNLRDDLGGPKNIKEFYRWNTPHLVYGFDREFVRFFGVEGINAVNDAMRAINDFFEPEDGQYSGVSELDLIRHGYQNNFATYWINTTAANENLMDVKSLALGMMVNYLGLGNPYRYMFTATNAYYADPNNAGSVVFGVTLKNYDPITLNATDVVNGDLYSYRLIHDQTPGFLPDPAAGNVAGVTLDMEEYTVSDSVNTYSSVAAIVDAYYGNTDVVWTRVPSRFGFGVYYDGLNASGGMYKPRHALTYDDAGGLRYMYNTNTIAMEYQPYTLIAPADFTKTIKQYKLASSQTPLGNRIAGVFPTRNNGPLPGTIPSIHPLSTLSNPNFNVGAFMTGANPGLISGINGAVVGKMAWAWRGGIDSIQFHAVSYDSLLNMSHYATNYTWIDTFMTNAAIQTPVVSTLTNTTPGAAVDLVDSGPNYYTQTLGRAPASPDFIFSASQTLGVVGQQVQTAWVREAPFDELTIDPDPAVPHGPSSPNATTASGTTRWSGFRYNRSFYTETAGWAGPGIWASEPNAGANTATTGKGGLHVIFNSSINIGGFEVVWSGESSVVGNTIPPIQFQQWAWIKGPGSGDFVKFPQDYDVSNRLIENSVIPQTGVPNITMVSDNGGATPISPTSLTRTEEKLTIVGTGFRGATAIEMLSPSGSVVQTWYPAEDYILNDRLIEIPARSVGYEAEGYSRQMRVWNTVGPSELSNEKFNVNTGRPYVYTTSSDGLMYDRSEPLTINGVGFKSKVIHVNDHNQTLTHIRIDDLTNGPIYPAGGIPNYGVNMAGLLEVLSDSKAILHGGVLPASIDSLAGRKIRVSRGSTSTLSPAATTSVGGVSAKVQLSSLKFEDTLSPGTFIDVNASNALRRDATLRITGNGLNTTRNVELVQLNRQSFNPMILADVAKMQKQSDGTLLTLQPFAFTGSGADGHGSFMAKMRVVNDFGESFYSEPFNVNIQPEYLIQLAGPIQPPIGSDIAFSSGKLWNRDPRPKPAGMGMNIEFQANGGGLKGIKRIKVINATGDPADPANETGAYIDIPNGGRYGSIIAEDGRIVLDVTTAPWVNISMADSANSNDFKRFKLEGDRNGSFTGLAPECVLIGMSPVIDSFELNGSIVDRDYQRDNHTLTFKGSQLQLVNRLELVANNGLSITDAGGSPVGIYIGIQQPNVIHSVSPTQVDVNATAWLNNLNLGYADTIAGPTSGGAITDGRRFRLINPFSTSVPVITNQDDTVTVSERPDLTGNLSTIFNVPIYHAAAGNEHWIDIDGNVGGGVGATLPVVISVNPLKAGSLKGVWKIHFDSNRTGTWTVQNLQGANGWPSTASFELDPVTLSGGGTPTDPNGITVSQDGKTITLSPSFIDEFNTQSINAGVAPGAYWNDNQNSAAGRATVHRIRLETVAGQIASTTDGAAGPDTKEFYTFNQAMEAGVGAQITSITGTGWIAGAHYERNGTLILQGTGVDRATDIRFVDSTGNLLGGAAGGWISIAANPGIDVSVNNQITIAGDLVAFANIGHLIDSASDTPTELRRVQLQFASGALSVITSDLHIFSISRPIRWPGWPGVSTAEQIFLGNNPAFGQPRSDDGLYFAKYNAFGLRTGENLRINTFGNDARGVARIDFEDVSGLVEQPVEGTFDDTSIDFRQGGFGGAFAIAINNLHGFANGELNSNDLIISDGNFTANIRDEWHTDLVITESRRLKFTMRSGTVVYSPPMRSGLAPNLGAEFNLNTGTDGLNTFTTFNAQTGRLAFSRNISQLDFNATNIGTIGQADGIQNIWFETADDVWPFGFPEINSTAPNSELDAFDLFPARTYNASLFLTGVGAAYTQPTVNRWNVPPASFNNDTTFGDADTPTDDLTGNDTGVFFGGNDPRQGRRVIIETLFGQIRSAEITSVSKGWNFGLASMPGFTQSTAAENNATFLPAQVDVDPVGVNAWNGVTQTMGNAGNIVITNPSGIAGGVRAIRLLADGNQTDVLIQHDAVVTLAAGAGIERAFFYSTDGTQIVINDAFLDQVANGLQGLGTLFPESWTGVSGNALPANPLNPQAAVGAWRGTPNNDYNGVPGNNSGGAYIAIITAANEGYDEGTALGGNHSGDNVIGPFATQ